MKEEIRKQAHMLGDMIKETEESKNLDAALDAYERSESLMALIGEYNAQQEASASDAADNEEIRNKISARLDELYDEIMKNPDYQAYISAKAAFDTLYNEMIGEINFAITGEAPCTHDCSSCHGCH